MNRPIQVPLSQLQPHPDNPRIEPRQEVVDQIASMISGEFDSAHALIVRPLGSGQFQIVSGHHRVLAAQKAGLDHVPCWVREMTDDEAYMELVRCNTQSELHPLEEGKHAAQSGMDLKSYAERAGKGYQGLYYKQRAFSVYHVVNGKSEMRDSWRNLSEIHAAPQWLWPDMVFAMLEGKWTVAVTRDQVAKYKAIEDPPSWADHEMIASRLLGGSIAKDDIPKLALAVSQAKVRNDDPEEDFRKGMLEELIEARPMSLSQVLYIVGKWERLQAEKDAEKNKAAQDKQRASEQARERIVKLRKNCSLEEWKNLAKAEQELLLIPPPESGGTFNQQKGDSIEWAQWSWNPVTGCKHDCPYCYARDIALSERMQQASLYPNGWEPTFRSEALNAPRKTRVPKDAETDTRFKNVFTCSMADLFGRWVPSEWIEAVMMAVKGNPQWNFLFLSKFPQRLADLDIPANAWLGTTVDLQARIANAEKAFSKITSGVRWLSVEPMLEPIHLEQPDLFNWVVIGGASSSKQTPEWKPPYRWIESLVRQCDDAGIPVYMKSNLGIANRVLQLPFSSPIKLDPQQAPAVFSYLK